MADVEEQDRERHHTHESKHEVHYGMPLLVRIVQNSVRRPLEIEAIPDDGYDIRIFRVLVLIISYVYINECENCKGNENKEFTGLIILTL